MEFRILLVLLVLIKGCVAANGRSSLIEELVGADSGYNKLVLPVSNTSHRVLVTIRLAVKQIRELDERNQYLQMLAWMKYSWHDDFLVWNASEHSIKRIHIPVGDIWRPDIALYNSVDQERTAVEIVPETNAQVYPDGTVIWLGPAVLQSSCKIKVGDYPFDIQRCPLQFGPWTHDAWEVNVTFESNQAERTKLMRNEEWTILDFPCVRNEVTYACCPEPYADVTCTVVMKRKPLFYLYNLLFPCVLLLTIGTLVFCLPPESGEKVSLAVTVLLAMSVYQLIIVEQIPPSSDQIPILNQYFGASIVMLCLSTILAVLVMNWHFDGVHGVRPPHWIHCLVLEGIATIVCLKKETRRIRQIHKNRKKRSKSNPNGSIHLTNYMVNEEAKSSHSDDVTHNGGPHLGNHLGDTLPSPSEDPAFISIDAVNTLATDGTSGTNNISKIGSDILHEMRQHKQEVTEQDDIEAEWRLIALVMDRAFLIVFLLLIVAITATIFSRLARMESIQQL